MSRAGEPASHDSARTPARLEVVVSAPQEVHNPLVPFFRLVPVVAAVVACASLSACVPSKESREAADRLDDALGTPSWATDVTVDAALSGLSTDQVQTVVVLRDEATAEEIGGFVADFIPIADEAGLGASYDLEKLRFERADGTGLTVYWEGPADEARAVDGVRRWQGVVAEFGPTVSATLGTEGDNDYWIDLGQGKPETAVADAYDTIRSAGLSAAGDSWQVGQQVDDAGFALTGDTLPSAAAVSTYRALVATTSLLPADWHSTGVSMTLYPTHTSVDFSLLAPAEVTRENILPTTYGDDLWPTFRAQLDAVSAIDGDWAYLVQWAGVEVPDWTSIMLSLLSDDEPIDNGDPATEWSFGAYDYVNAAVGDEG